VYSSITAFSLLPDRIPSYALSVSGLVGREPELGAVDAFVGAAEEGLRALAIVGEPGIGKTTLWQEAVRRARSNGLVVLAARASESEAKLAFAGLTDLLRDIGSDVLADLPPPQRSALEVALLRAEAGRTPGRRLVGTGLHSVLAALAAAGPLLLAIDDAQWLDAPTSSAVDFALRRLDEQPVRLLVSVRAQTVLPGFVSALDDGRLQRLELGPLSVAALQRIVADRLGVVFPRPTLVRLASASRGNAFFALEIARLLAARDAHAWTSAPLPVPDDLRTLVEERIARLPRDTRTALLRTAALARATPELVDVAALAAAEEDGLVTVSGGVVDFTHPLFASAVYGSASRLERARTHHELASVVHDPEERARHLALAADAPDEPTAAALADAGQRARARGAPDAAAELAELAVRLTPDDAARDERTLALAEHLLLAGDFRRAADVLEGLIAHTADGDLRARARLTLADIVYWRSGESAALRLGEAAVRDAVDPLLRARCLAVVAMQAGTRNLPRAAEAARASLDVLGGRPDADPGLVSLALSARVRADLFLGEGLDREAAERALELELEADAPPLAVDTRVGFKLGQWLRYVDDFDGARRHLAASETAAAEEGDESSLANILLNRTLLECWSGDWETAATLAQRTQEGFVLTGMPTEPSALWRAYVDSHYGRLDAVRALAAAATGTHEPAARMLWERSLGLAELTAGDPGAANAHFARALAALAEMGFVEPAVWRVDGDAIEAALAAGDVERAEALLEPFEAAAARSRIPWSLAVSGRCRGLVLAARGRVPEAVDALERALVEHERSPVPFERARTLLAHGQVLRRLKQKRDARASLEGALELFDGIGAAPWTRRARDELGRTAVRVAPDDLSATELRIARLAAAGLTNDAIATEVFVSRKTVEANLSRAYRKLGIRSRAQLARALDAREEPAIP
jgi:DNA-binding CsgD family transcriptional regulator